MIRSQYGLDLSALTHAGGIILRNPVILCADDEEANIELLREILIPNGYQVVAVTNGRDALLKIKSRAVDLVLLDINMPKMDGLEVCRQVKKDEDLRDTPIIMITGLSSYKDRIRGFEAGAEGYLTKPFHHEELLARIKILQKRKGSTMSKLAEFQREAALAALPKSHDELDYRCTPKRNE